MIAKRHSEIFEGCSMPGNKEVMRIFKDLEMVEYLGSGMPRILQFYDRLRKYRLTEKGKALQKQLKNDRRN